MRHIYVHVPFCARRCSYCDFSIAVRKQIPADRFVAAIRREVDVRRGMGEWEEDPIETLYFGGGTPSLLPGDSLAELVALLVVRQSGRPADAPPLEITVEANPDDVTQRRASEWVAAGVNRVSLGAQSFHPRVLEWMHRTHTVDATSRAVGVLRDAGISSLSLDLIFGLPEELGASFERDLENALALEPDHMSVYGLSVEQRTPLARWITRGASSAPSDQRYADEFLLADLRLTEAGFRHYEVSNYSRPGREARHNSAYWADRDYLGLGPAAHSRIRGVRQWNWAQWAAYEKTMRGGSDPTEQREKLTPRQQQIEQLYLALRTDGGVEGGEWWRIRPEQERAWRGEGWLLKSGNRYRLTPSGWLRLDEFVASLTTSAEGG